MSYRVEFAPHARRDLLKLDRPVQARLASAIGALATDPRPAGAKKLADSGDLWRLRVGDYRVVYQIHDRILTVLVVKIGHRGDVYRR